MGPFHRPPSNYPSVDLSPITRKEYRKRTNTVRQIQSCTHSGVIQRILNAETRRRDTTAETEDYRERQSCTFKNALSIRLSMPFVSVMVCPVRYVIGLWIFSRGFNNCNNEHVYQL